MAGFHHRPALGSPAECVPYQLPPPGELGQFVGQSRYEERCMMGAGMVGF
jgi:hypothetical protein